MRSQLVVIVTVISLVRGALAQPSDVAVDDRRAPPDALKAGAADVEAGTALGEQNKYELALGKFLSVANAYPSATHDCYVALSYLRIGRLTLARLWFDAADRRGDPRPVWCKQAVGTELAAALATRGFVEVPVKLTPEDAEAWVGEAHFTGSRKVWLPPGATEVRAEQAGYTPVRRTVTAAAGEPVELVLVTEPGAPAEPPRPVGSHHGRKAAWVVLGGGGAALVAGAVFHVLAARTRTAANNEPTGTPRFDELDRRFVRERGIALGGYALGAAGVAVGLWLVRRGHDTPSAPSGLALGIDREAVFVTWSGVR